MIDRITSPCKGFAVVMEESGGCSLRRVALDPKMYRRTYVLTITIKQARVETTMHDMPPERNFEADVLVYHDCGAWQCESYVICALYISFVDISCYISEYGGSNTQRLGAKEA
ncbi:uncharacterized protein MCYG_05429 [Microsporum canis CBS 113480]|uniref:Uncharacterized protein n=1 Tax=Arthroderma otae (strain ATCC MYA-4605 / CBS 113480) TaxID=554155 RepID=C5FRV7_ARTOC|nr:uncharacterized protein MCYG_05429 [Microsporum canis CBS 113480]EEQ32610.1 predicted protein [Microsporum canis CBS 113480]